MGCPIDRARLIAVDTSALMAVILSEAAADRCMMVLEGEPELLISAATVAEALIVAARRGVSIQMASLIDGLGFDVVPVTSASAWRAAVAYERWGECVHPAALNFVDCFAYEIAQANSCPLLFVGEDFAKTDVARALS
jgi:ribonuclease VapC